MFHLNVFFWGLICHVDTLNKGERAEFAALVEADHHTRTIAFGPNESYELAGNVWFDATERADIDQDGFGEYVPHLRSILGGALNIDPGTYFVSYAKGDGTRCKLSVALTYKKTATHRSKASGRVKRFDRPVARLIRLEAEVSEERVVYFEVKERGRIVVKEKTIDQDSCILIANVGDVDLYKAAVDLELAGKRVESMFDRFRETAGEYTKDTASSISDAAESLRRFAASVKKEEKVTHFEHFSKLVAQADTSIAEEGRAIPAQASIPQDCSWVLEEIDTQYRADAGSRPECGNTNWP